jgi:hypothetical protein
MAAMYVAAGGQISDDAEDVEFLRKRFETKVKGRTPYILWCGNGRTAPKVAIHQYQGRPDVGKELVVKVWTNIAHVDPSITRIPFGSIVHHKNNNQQFEILGYVTWPDTPLKFKLEKGRFKAIVGGFDQVRVSLRFTVVRLLR